MHCRNASNRRQPWTGNLQAGTIITPENEPVKMGRGVGGQPGKNGGRQRQRGEQNGSITAHAAVFPF